MIEWDTSPTKPLLVYTHLAKTGGTSLENGLRTMFGDRWLRLNLVKRPDLLPELPAEHWRSLAVVCSNSSFPMLDALLGPKVGRPIVGLVTVRDPVERLKSLYVYMREGAVDIDGVKTTETKAPQFDGEFEDFARRILEGMGSRSLGRRQCKTLCSGRASADAAIEVIERRFAAAVTTSSVGRLLESLAIAYELKPPPPIHLQRGRATKLTLSPQYDQALREAFLPDQTLFDWVRDNESRMLDALTQGRLAALGSEAVTSV